MSTVYLIHFNRRLKHAGHYLGFSTNLDKRITDHLCGMGARLMEVVTEAGIEWNVARTWPGATRSFELRLKNGKNAPQLCPVCSGAKALNRARVAAGAKIAKGAAVNSAPYINLRRSLSRRHDRILSFGPSLFKGESQ